MFNGINLVIPTLVLSNIMLIYVITIFGRDLQNYVFSIINRQDFFFFIAITFFLSFIIFKYLLRGYIVSDKYFSFRSLSWIIVMIYAQYLIVIPEEKMHIVLFSFLGLICSNIYNYKIGILISIFVSISDEILQHILPDRYFGWDDIFMNLFASLFTIFVFRFWKKYD